MRIAIHPRDNSFSKRWIEYCELNNISYKLVDCYRSDIIEQLSDCNGLMWHWPQIDYKTPLFAKQLILSVEKLGIKVFPNVNTSWHFDDKVGQKYLLEAIDAPLVPTNIFYTKNEALEWINNTTFPKVFKLRGGAGSVNVELVKNKSRAKQLTTKAFGKGFNSINKFGDFKDRILWQFKNQPNLINLKSLLKGFIKLFLKSDIERFSSKEKGYIYFQDFIPNNNFDTRLIVIGNRCFAVRRHNRKNDFRASGSGIKSYEPELFDDKTVSLAFKISRDLGAQSMAYDFIYNNGEAKLVEISYCFITGEFYDNCHGYWDENMNWYREEVNPQFFMIEDFIKEIEDSF